MNQSTIEFEEVVWPNTCIKSPAINAPPRMKAEIVAAKGHAQIEGVFVASCVEHNNARYLILRVKRAKTLEMDEATGSVCSYQAFHSDLKIDAAAWCRGGWDTAPELMCRAVILESCQSKPFWGWEVHQPTPGEGWYLLKRQNIERLVAPANYWADEIECGLIPKIRARLDRVPQILDRCERILRAQSRFPEYINTIYVKQGAPTTITQQDMVRDNLVRSIDDYWRWENPQTALEFGYCDLKYSIPRLERRLIQGQVLLQNLRGLGTQPIEMQRTMVRSEREHALPIPAHPLSLATKTTNAPPLRVRIR